MNSAMQEQYGNQLVEHSSTLPYTGVDVGIILLAGLLLFAIGLTIYRVTQYTE